MIAVHYKTPPESLLHGKLELQTRETSLQHLPPPPPTDPALTHTHSRPRQYLQEARLLQISTPKVK